jgi:hypothetical protein
MNNGGAKKGRANGTRFQRIKVDSAKTESLIDSRYEAKVRYHPLFHLHEYISLELPRFINDPLSTTGHPPRRTFLSLYLSCPEFGLFVICLQRTGQIGRTNKRLRTTRPCGFDCYSWSRVQEREEQEEKREL